MNKSVVLVLPWSKSTKKHNMAGYYEFKLNYYNIKNSHQ